jgi:serralysin
MAVIFGTSGDDIITPSVKSSGVSGFPTFFDDYINGGLGADTMNGGDGNDTYWVDNIGDIVKEDFDDALGGTADAVFSSVNYSLLPGDTYNSQGYGIERLYLTGTASIKATGNAKNNVIIGNSGNNVLDGGAGADTMGGSAGNDIYFVDNVGDIVKEDFMMP